ncbi:MAG: hypothetical protein JWM53_1149, partial [bacterium]|nr:hypothetical protein [bacterium]
MRTPEAAPIRTVVQGVAGLLAGVAVVTMLTGVSGCANKPQQTPAPPIYNPYPPAILPADLDAELARVQAEVTTIFNQALGEWHALPPPMVTSNPPTLQGSGYQAVQTLGKLLNYDMNMSPF